MPMPKPNSGEDREHFMNRCMGNDMMNTDFPENDQRAAVCMTSWRDANKAAAMPMDGESHDTFMRRCVGMMGDGGEETCQLMWDEVHKSTRLQFWKDKGTGMRYIGAPMEVKELSETGTFEGLASVYGNVDLGGDVVEAGAFKEFVFTKDGSIRILDGHDSRRPIGKGKLTDSYLGLAIKGKLNLAIARGREVYELMKDGIVDGLSIGYDIMPNGEEVKNGVRYLKSLKLWEVSTTIFPMNQSALVSGVKSLEPVRTVRECEDLLRDAVGLSRAQAKLHAGAIWKTLTGQREADGGDSDVQRILGLLSSIKPT